MMPLCFKTLWWPPLLLGWRLLPLTCPMKSQAILCLPLSQVPSLAPSWPLSRKLSRFPPQVRFLLPKIPFPFIWPVNSFPPVSGQVLFSQTPSLTLLTMSTLLTLHAFPSEHLSQLNYRDWDVCFMSPWTEFQEGRDMVLFIATFTVLGTEPGSELAAEI